ncbi:hypothetical protein [Colwellia sp. PAMC 21821]|uniref:hypothetical protein n=1 Tax=Colwellia sp. PAMC 21821 TaxID=1816219 RepID=UPI0009BE5D74|nr:hypothetical protein [Colwellia sp. PAMC 21821]ARD43589.1 hypothetical protein A3Q33_04260 [Colwellia sp. PAMC 21821]
MKMSLNNFKYQNVAYNYNDVNGTFETNYDKDLHLVVIWSKARIKEKEIIAELDQSFNILGCFDTTWSQEHIDNNFHRIYDVAPTGGKAGKREEVGDQAFMVVVIQDTKPKYQYRTDASGRLKIVNANVVDKKHLFRKWVGGSYMVHSTDNLKEFFNNAILFFGKEYTFELIDKMKWDKNASIINNDLVGANGWNSCKELFETLNLTTEYVVLRGSDKIEDTVSTLSGDVDILCSDIGEFAAAANGINIWNSKNFFHVNIAGKQVLFDIRYVGDDYFDEKWQKDIIKNRVLDKNGVNIPRVDDYFFSHLYHAYIHKPLFFDKYIGRLTGLAEKIGIKNFKDDCQNNPSKIVKLLRGYLLAHNYQVSIPKDEQVYININFISEVQRINSMKLYLRVFGVKIKNFPQKMLMNTKVLIKKNKMLFNILIALREKYNQHFKNGSS